MLTPEQAEQLAAQRKSVRRARGQGRRWYLRAALMLVVGWWAFRRGGSVNLTVAIAMVALATLSISMGRSLRRSADAAEAKLRLMEQDGLRDRPGTPAEGHPA